MSNGPVVLTVNKYRWSEFFILLLDNNPQSTPLNGQSQTTPESHKVLLKPTPDCWEYALAFMATLPDGAKYARIMEDEDKLLEFERQLIVTTYSAVLLNTF